MINFTVTDKKIFKQKVPAFAFIIEEGKVHKELKQFAKEFSADDLLEIIKQSDFTGKKLQTKLLPFLAHGKLANLILVGVGKIDDDIEVETYRRALGKVVRTVQAKKCETFALHLPSAKLFDVDQEFLAKQTSIIIEMANYQFIEFFTVEGKKATEIFDATICVDAKQKNATQKGIKEGQYIGYAVNQARHWIDLPPSALTPPQLADKAKEIAKNNNLKFTEFNEKQIIKMGMGGLASVSRGSDVECRLAILEYKTKHKKAPTIAFVGKGITFDSGGLSLKPPAGMENMKDDMSGAAAVIAAMGAIGTLKPNINVIGITPLAENLPSGKATKPGDVVRFYNGKTAEVRNTDAEGRLILADALAYAEKEFKPDAIIDLATLTGLCAYFFGPFYAACFATDDNFLDQVEYASALSGDRIWHLPLHDDYKPAINTPMADIANTGSGKYKSGTITATHFLKNFVEDTPWVHLDIAGTAFNVPDLPYQRSGATGFGVRLLVELALNWE